MIEAESETNKKRGEGMVCRVELTDRVFLINNTTTVPSSASPSRS
jgi:hypothetical protein